MVASMQKLPLGISDFKEIRKNDYYFVDKSLFICFLQVKIPGFCKVFLAAPQ